MLSTWSSLLAGAAGESRVHDRPGPGPHWLHDSLADVGGCLPVVPRCRVAVQGGALRAATATPARRFGLTDRGRITPGARADLLLVDGDPTTTIADTLSIRAVWRRGVRQTPA